MEAGYRIEDEQPVPINGFSSFTAVRAVADEDSQFTDGLTVPISKPY